MDLASWRQQKEYTAARKAKSVLQAQTFLQNQIPQLIAARNNYRISQVNLARTLGIPADRQYASDEPLPIIGKLEYNPIKYDLANALVTARANRPFLKATAFQHLVRGRERDCPGRRI